MPLWKQLLLSLYYHGTVPGARVGLLAGGVERPSAGDRALLSSDRRRPGQPVDDFQRHVRPADRLAAGAIPSSFRSDDAQQRIRSAATTPSRASASPSTTATPTTASKPFPWLVKQRIPCTYFVTVQNVLTGEPFSHDLVMGHRFAPNTLEQLRAMAAAGIEIGAHAYTHADLGAITDPRLLRYEVVTAKEELEAVLGRPIRYFAFPLRTVQQP